MKKGRWTALILAAALTFSMASAADGLFPAAGEYPGFGDVAEDGWYADAVRTCCETGLMKGKDGGLFDPGGTVTAAEAATIAARILEAVSGEPIGFREDGPWYQAYTDYLTEHGVDCPARLGEPAARQDFFGLLAAVVPESLLPAINSLTALPDTDDPAVLRFYNAGILTGVDDEGTFHGAGTLSRAECAAMVARIVRPELRKRFFLREPEAADWAELLGRTAFNVGEAPVTFRVLGPYVAAVMKRAEQNYYQKYFGLFELDWEEALAEAPELKDQVLTAAMEAAAVQGITDYMRKLCDCTTLEELAAMYPDPPKETLVSFLEDKGYRAVRMFILYSPEPGDYLSKEWQDRLFEISREIGREPISREEFEVFYQKFNEEPELDLYPNGVLGTKSELVERFGGTYGTQVKGPEHVVNLSGDGKKIWGIFDLDLEEVLEHDDVRAEALGHYKMDRLDREVNELAEEVPITPNQPELDRLDLLAFYRFLLGGK